MAVLFFVRAFVMFVFPLGFVGDVLEQPLRRRIRLAVHVGREIHVGIMNRSQLGIGGTRCFTHGEKTLP